MRLFILTLAIASLAAGCGGGSEEASEPLQAGVYEYELTEQYLLDNGISQFQAENGVGRSQGDARRGRLVLGLVEDGGGRRARAAERTRKGTRAVSTFKWTSGCFGDWEMTYSVDGDTVTWSDQEALPPTTRTRTRRSTRCSTACRGRASETCRERPGKGVDA